MARKVARPSKSSSKQKARHQLQKPRRETRVATVQKPVFRIGTLITVLLLAGMIFLAVYLNNRKDLPDTDATPTSGTTFVFPPGDLGNATSVEISPIEGETVRVARNTEGAWALELPEETEANQSQAEAAATQVSSIRILGEIPDADPGIFGLDEPEYVIKVKFTGGTEHVLEIGDTTPTNNGYYARLDDEEKVIILSLSGIESLVNLVAAPPYLNTPTPTSLPPTETPIPPTESSTPESPAAPTVTSTP